MTFEIARSSDLPRDQRELELRDLPLREWCRDPCSIDVSTALALSRMLLTVDRGVECGGGTYEVVRDGDGSGRHDGRRSGERFDGTRVD